jgi:hypothetical protein
MPPRSQNIPVDIIPSQNSGSSFDGLSEKVPKIICAIAMA